RRRASGGHGSAIRLSASGVGRNETVTRWRRSQARSETGVARVSSSGRWTLAPAVRYGHSSQPVASNAGLVTWVARSAGVTANARWWQRTRVRRPPRAAATPAGGPEAPEA